MNRLSIITAILVLTAATVLRADMISPLFPKSGTPVTNTQPAYAIDLCTSGSLPSGNTYTGLACDYQTTLTATLNGSAVTDPSTPINCGLAKAGQLISVWYPPNGTASYNIYQGTIASCTNHTINLTAAYGGAPVSGAQAMWGSDDLAAWNGLMTALLTGPRPNVPARLNCRKPIMTSGELTVNLSSIEFAGAGETNLTNNNAGCGLVWVPGSYKNAPVMHVRSSIGFRAHDFIWLGSDLYPPSAGIMQDQPSGTPGSGHNWIYRVIGGGLANYGLGPGSPIGDTSGTMAADHTATQTSIALTSAPTGLLPGAEVRFVDPTGNGTEVGFTTNAVDCRGSGVPWACCTGNGTGASCYQRGANPILLQRGLRAAHTAASTTVFWDQAEAETCMSLGPNSTQNDSQTFDDVGCLETDIPFYSEGLVGVDQSVNINIGTMNVKNFGIGVAMPDNGQAHITNLQLLGAGPSYANGAAGIELLVGGFAHLDITNMVAEVDRCDVGGSNYIATFGSGNVGGSGLGTLTIGFLAQPITSCMPSNGDFIDNVAESGTASNIKINEMTMIETNTVDKMSASVQPTIHVRTGNAQVGWHKVYVTAETLSRTHQLQYSDAGSSNAAYIRDISLKQIPMGAGQPRWAQQVLSGQDRLVWNLTNPLAITTEGDFTVNPVQVHQPTSLTCHGGGTGEDYYYVESCMDGTGNMTAASTVAGPIECAATLDNTTNWVSGVGGPCIGANTYRIFEGKATHGSAAPAVSAFEEVADTFTFDIQPAAPGGALLGVPGWLDVGAVIAIAPPTVNDTGMTNLNGPSFVSQPPTALGEILSMGKSQGQTTVANAPTYQWLVDNFPGVGAHWSMNEGSGNLTDGTGHSNTATAVGAGLTYGQAGSVKDSSDKAIKFPGSSASYFTVASSGTLPSGDQISVCFAIKRATTADPAGEVLFSQKTNGLELLFSTGLDQLIARKVGGANMYDIPTALTSTSSYYFICYEKNGADNHFYLGDANSIADATNDIGGNLTLAPADASEWIGTDNTGGSADEFNGDMDEVFVGPIALTAGQVTQIWNYWRAIKLGAWNWFIDGTAGSCPVTGSGPGCEGLFESTGWCCPTL